MKDIEELYEARIKESKAKAKRATQAVTNATKSPDAAQVCVMGSNPY